MAESTAASAPSVEWNDLADFVQENYGKGWTFEREFPSDRDRNFKLARAEDSGGGGSGEAGCEDVEAAVLKVFNPAEELAFIECQHAAAQRIAKRWPAEPLLCQLPVASASGKTILQLPPRQGSADVAASYFVHVVQFLPGEVVAEAPQSSSLLSAIGTAMGKVTTALLDFDHPAAHRHFVWDLAHCHEVFANHLSRIQEPAKKELIKGCIDQFDKVCRPHLQELRRSVVHNDGNDHNLLARRSKAQRDEADCWEVSVIDFGDLVHSYTVADPAIALAYLLFDKIDPIEETLPFVRSFHAECPLHPLEQDCLFPLAVMRVCTSLCMSVYQRTLRPDDEYLSISEAPGWRLMEQLRGKSFAEVQRRYREALAP